MSLEDNISLIRDSSCKPKKTQGMSTLTVTAFFMKGMNEMKFMLFKGVKKVINLLLMFIYLLFRPRNITYTLNRPLKQNLHNADFFWSRPCPF